MINPEFTKRLSQDLGDGGGGWAPWYMFYMGAGAQVATRPVMLSHRLETLPSTSVGDPFIGGAYGAPYWNMYQAPGVASVGKNLAMSAAYKNRMRDGLSTADYVKSHLVASQGDAPGLQHTSVVQNWYRFPAYGNTPKAEARTPLVISEINPSVPLDASVSAFSYETETTVEVGPDVTVGPGLLPRLAESIGARLSMATGYEIGWDWSGAETNLGASYYPVLADNDMARAVSKDPLVASNANSNDSTASASSEDGWSRSIRTFCITSGKSMLDVTDTSKLMRSTASVLTSVEQGGYLGAAGLHGAMPTVLRLGYTEDLNANENTQFLCLYSAIAQGHNPIVSYLSGNKIAVPGIKPVEIANWYHQSMNYWGWSADSTNTLTATTTGVRSPLYMNHVIVPSRTGLPGHGAYKLEAYLKNVIEVSLTNHLPIVGADGHKTSYFKNGAFVTRPETGSKEDYEDNIEQVNGSHIVQQPVAFPSAQEPEDPWLYYVSMDDNYVYHLNRQELGKAHISEELATMRIAPIQIGVLAGKCWMLFRRSIRVYDTTTKQVTVYNTGLPTTMTAITVDNEKAKVYVGHLAGVFEISTGTRVDVDLSAMHADARAVGETRLRAVNGYLTWVSTSDDLQSGETDPNKLAWVNTTTGKTRDWGFIEFSGKQDFRGVTGDSAQVAWGFVASNVRSNGDLVVVANEAGAYGTHNHSVTWAKVNEDGSFRRQFFRSTLWERSLGNDTAYQRIDGIRNRVHIYRVDDMHYSILNVPYSQVRRMSKLVNFSDLAKVKARESNYMGRGGAIGHIYNTDIRIDDDNLFILKDPGRQFNGVAGGNYSGEGKGFMGVTAWHDFTYKMMDNLNYSKDGYKIAGFNGVETRTVDLMSAVNSGCVIVLNKAYTNVFAGVQGFSQIGVELDWDGTNWVHGTAGKTMRSRPTHTTTEQISPWSQVSFSSTVPVTLGKVHRVRVYPGCTRPKSRWYLYAGDLIPATVDTTLTTNMLTFTEGVGHYSYMGVDYTRAELFTATLDGVALTYATSYPPASGQFYLPPEQNMIVFNSDAVGKHLILNYSYVKAAV